jgi:uncharacterized protein YdeI (YjbR/CyaY-like superfamily)
VEALVAAGRMRPAGLAERYAMLHSLQTAKRPDTRARRIAQFVTMIGAGGGISPGE